MHHNNAELLVCKSSVITLCCSLMLTLVQGGPKNWHFTFVQVVANY